MIKRDTHPLPWNEKWDKPYWSINLYLCGCADGWRERQSGLSMSQIIPMIDTKIAEMEQA